MEPPLRIKLYGLVTVTRRGYLIQVGIMVFLLFVLLVAWLKVPAPAELRNPTPEYLRLVALLNWIPWIVLAFALAIGMEAFFVLRRFAREEARRRTEQPPKPPQP